MTQNTIDLLDQTLINEEFKTPEQAISAVLSEVPPYETVTDGEKIWMWKQIKEQFKNGFSIKLFKKERG